MIIRPADYDRTAASHQGKGICFRRQKRRVVLYLRLRQFHQAKRILIRHNGRSHAGAAFFNQSFVLAVKQNGFELRRARFKQIFKGRLC